MDGICTQAGMIRVGTTWEPEITTWYNGIIAVGSSISGANILVANDYVGGCKFDGVWTPQKASCLMAGPDDLTGALVPLIGAAPTNFNFVSGDYSRTTGLVGDGSTKYLNSNRNNNADPQDSRHLAVWRTTSESRDATRGALCSPAGAGSSGLLTTTSIRFYRVADTAGGIADTATTTGFWGVSRSASNSRSQRFAGVTTVTANSSTTPVNGSILVFSRGGAEFSNARISFYSIGENNDLVLLDARLTAYMAALT